MPREAAWENHILSQFISQAGSSVVLEEEGFSFTSTLSVPTQHNAQEVAGEEMRE